MSKNRKDNKGNNRSKDGNNDKITEKESSIENPNVNYNDKPKEDKESKSVKKSFFKSLLDALCNMFSRKKQNSESESKKEDNDTLPPVETECIPITNEKNEGSEKPKVVEQTLQGKSILHKDGVNDVSCINNVENEDQNDHSCDDVNSDKKEDPIADLVSVPEEDDRQEEVPNQYQQIIEDIKAKFNLNCADEKIVDKLQKKLSKSSGEDSISKSRLEALLERPGLSYIKVIYNGSSNKTVSFENRLLNTLNTYVEKTINIDENNIIIETEKNRPILNSYIVKRMQEEGVFTKHDLWDKKPDTWWHSYIEDVKKRLEGKESTNTNDVSNNSEGDECDILKEIDDKLNVKFKDQRDQISLKIESVEALIDKIEYIIKQGQSNSRREISESIINNDNTKDEEVQSKSGLNQDSFDEGKFIEELNKFIKELGGKSINHIEELSLQNIIQSSDYGKKLGSDKKEISDKLEDLLKIEEKVKSLLKTYKIEDISDIEKGILNETIKTKLKDKEIISNEDLKVYKNISEIVDKLISIDKRKNDEINKMKDEIEKSKKEIHEKFDGIDDIIVVNEVDKLSDLIQLYSQKIKDIINEKKGIVEQLKKDKDLLKNSNTELTSNLKSVNEKIAQVKNQIKSRLAVDIARLEKVKGCSFIEEDEGSEDFENGLRKKLEDALANLKKCGTDSQEDVLQLYKDIQDVVERELIRVDDKNDKAFNVVCKYYAYSRLAFMTDQSRESEVKFDRESMAKIFDAVNTLLTDFGIVVNIPALFAETITDGDYEDVTGKCYSELDILCSNVRNHKEKIDNVNHEDIIIDFDLVGYAKEGEMIRKTNVII